MLQQPVLATNTQGIHSTQTKITLCLICLNSSGASNCITEQRVVFLVVGDGMNLQSVQDKSVVTVWGNRERADQLHV